MSRAVNLSALIMATVAFWAANHYYPDVYIYRLFFTFLALSIIYLVFDVALESIVMRGIKEKKTRYSFRKAVSVLFYAFSLVAVIGIWVENRDTLVVSYGLVAAGVAIALQDFFKNFVGGISIFVTGIYRIGDRIEIASKKGDVIEIGIFYTTLLELREWVDGDQVTGRLSIVPNWHVLSSVVDNYTKDHEFIWDELVIPITYDSDWKRASALVLGIVRKATEDITGQAEREMSNMEEKYYFTKRAAEPALFIKLTDNWIQFHVRYVTRARERRVLQTRLSRKILLGIQRSENIRISSTTSVVSMKDLKDKY